jgi:hypothetical protein
MPKDKIECKDGFITYKLPMAMPMPMPILTTKSVYIASRIIHGLSNNHPLLCYEMSNMAIFNDFIVCLKELGLDKINIKWINDLLNLEKWVSMFKMKITSNFTRGNLNKSVTKIQIFFPWRPHIDYTAAPDTEIAANAFTIEQHCYQFVFKCFYESLPGTKTGSVENRYFEFLYSKDKYKRRDQIENIVNQFISDYREKICTDGLKNIIWCINKIDTPFFVVAPPSLSAVVVTQKRKLEECK